MVPWKQNSGKRGVAQDSGQTGKYSFALCNLTFMPDVTVEMNHSSQRALGNLLSNSVS